MVVASNNQSMHHAGMFGFHDYIVDPRSGRPRAHYSWPAERFITWTIWISAAISLVFAATYYSKWREMDFPMQSVLTSVVLAAISSWRERMLNRKRAALRDAVKAYEAMIAKPLV